MKFRVKGGNHVEDGITYKKGDIIESPRDLTKVFRNKFERLHDGDDVEDDGILEETSLQPEIPHTVKKVKSKKSKKSVKKEEPKSLEELYGRDVTDDFPEAEDVGGVRVFANKAKWYTVIDVNDNNAVLHEGKLRRKEVKPLLDTYLEDEDGDNDESEEDE